jgi:hypothetical protein
MSTESNAWTIVDVVTKAFEATTVVSGIATKMLEQAKTLMAFDSAMRTLEQAKTIMVSDSAMKEFQ